MCLNDSHNLLAGDGGINRVHLPVLHATDQVCHGITRYSIGGSKEIDRRDIRYGEEQDMWNNQVVLTSLQSGYSGRQSDRQPVDPEEVKRSDVVGRDSDNHHHPSSQGNGDAVGIWNGR
jgi:hypothetical protein